MVNWHYQIVIKDGKRLWEKISKDEDQPIQREIVGETLQLDANSFENHDLVEITHHPPIEPANCRPFSELLDYIKTLPPRDKFRPYVFWNSYWPGGMLEIVWKDRDYYVDYEWDNKHLARCIDFETGELIGVKVEGIANIKLGVDQKKNIS